MPANNLYIDKVKERSDRIIIPEKEFLNEKQLEQLNEALQKFPEIICEIGSGSGSHLVEFAKKNPQHLAIGVELRFKRLYKTLEKAEQFNLANILLMLANAHKLDKYLPKNSLSGVYINFPDPWSKRRWLKHRIMQQSWIDSICTLLKPGAYISYKTDHTEYFQQARILLENHPQLKVLEVSEDLHKSPYNESNIKTEFEKLFISKGLKINYIKAIYQNNQI